MNSRFLRRPNLLVMHADPIVRAGIAAALCQHAAFKVFEHGTDPIDPQGPGIDVVIADYTTALRFVDHGVRRSHGLPASAKVLTLTPNDRQADIRRAIEAGVHGYLLVGGSLGELIDGVTAVANGMRYMSPSVAHRMAESLTRAPLTSRELEVLRLVATGRANKEIARELGIDGGAVKTHVSTLMAKLGARSRTQAASIAVSRGLVNEVRVEVRAMPLPDARRNSLAPELGGRAELRGRARDCAR
jgi:DNA-binding NarL/FixJ family response regulator